MMTRRSLCLCFAVLLLALPISAQPKGDEPLWWSLRPLAKPAVPAVGWDKHKAWPLNPIDHFILATLKEKGLEPAPAAERRTLLRRVTFNLTGLPPTPDEMLLISTWAGFHSAPARCCNSWRTRLTSKPAGGVPVGTRVCVRVPHESDTASGNNSRKVKMRFGITASAKRRMVTMGKKTVSNATDGSRRAESSAICSGQGARREDKRLQTFLT